MHRGSCARHPRAFPGGFATRGPERAVGWAVRSGFGGNMTRTSLRGALTGAAIAAAAFLGAARASAAPVITVDIASVGGGYDPYTTTAEAVDQGNGTFVLSGVGYSANFSCDWSITIN